MQLTRYCGYQTCTPDINLKHRAPSRHPLRIRREPVQPRERSPSHEPSDSLALPQEREQRQVVRQDHAYERSSNHLCVAGRQDPV